jgi:hypothetical protein
VTTRVTSAGEVSGSGETEVNRNISENLQLLRDRYPISVGPLLMTLGVGLASSPLLAWTSGILLALLTVNRIAGSPQRDA